MARARKLFFIFIFGFIGGIFLGSFPDFFDPTFIFLFLILALAFGLFSLKGRKVIFVIVAVVFLGFTFGLTRIFLFSHANDFVNLASPNTVTGIVVADPDRRDKSTRLVVKLVETRRTRILILTDNFADYSYGDKIEITGKIKRPKNFLTDQNKTFDYQNYLLVRGVGEVSYYPRIKILEHNQGWVVKAWLFKVKNSFLGNLQRVIPEPVATLAGGLILGDKGGLGTKVEDDFRQAGLSHIIVLSGYNITIVAESVLKFFSWFTPAFSWLFGLASIFLFVLMTGGEAAAVRSAVMGAIALIARRYGRQYDAGVALIFAGFLMILWNPRLLVFDLGFQLSFLATLGLIYLSPFVSRLIDIDKVSLLRKTTSLPEVAFLKNSPVAGPKLAEVGPQVSPRSLFGGLKEIISTTTGAQMAVYPWLLYKAGNASLIGFISNVFILPAVPFAMFASFATGLAGFTSYYLSLLFSYPTYFLLEYILKGAHLFASLL